MKERNYISEVIGIAGLKETALACGIAYQQVRRWESKGHLPRTEFSGETEYAKSMSALVDNKVTRDQLLSMKPERKSA